MNNQMQRVVLARRPEGSVRPEDFRLENADIPELEDNQVLVKVHYMSLDPYMRGRMDDSKSYAASVPIGGTMEGGAVGEVIASKSDHFKPGDFAFGMFGWASHGILNSRELRKVDPAHGSITTSLGVLGMPGFTGWYGLTQLGNPKEGDTVVVAAATGPVGQMVGQVAKLRGCRVVGVAGGAEKCKLAVDKFGFDECLDHRAYDDPKALRAALKDACPNGVDVYFENVGGKILEAVITLMNVGGRIPVCGMIAWYDLGAMGAGGREGHDLLPKFWRNILVNRLQVTGFIISDHFEQFPAFMTEVGPNVASGKIAVQEDIAEGLENAPEAFMGMLKGKNFGKQIVKLA